MRTRYFSMGLILIMALVTAWADAHLFPVNMAWLIVAYFVVRQDDRTALGWAFGSGLILDLTNLNPLGVSSVVMLAGAAGIILLRRLLRMPFPPVPAVAIGAAEAVRRWAVGEPVVWLAIGILGILVWLMAFLLKARPERIIKEEIYLK